MRWTRQITACCSKVFICYRRDDTPWITDSIASSLKAHLGKRRIFIDVDSIYGGERFPEVLEAKLAESRVLLVIIGEHWLTDSAGRRRLDEDGDYVRLEIESALRQGTPIIPIVAPGVVMPARDRLPASIRDLADRQTVSVRRNPDFPHDMNRLIASLVHGHGVGTRRRCIALFLMSLAALALGLLAVALMLRDTRVEDGVAAPVPRAVSGASVEYLAVPPYGSSADLRGRARGVDPDHYRVTVYVFLETCALGWWGPKPYQVAPLTRIDRDGTWTVDITTGGCDEQATRIAAYVVPAGYVPPPLQGEFSLPEELGAHAVAAQEVVRGPPR